MLAIRDSLVVRSSMHGVALKGALLTTTCLEQEEAVRH